MDLSILSLVVNGLLGLVMYLLKAEHANLKEQLKENRNEIANVKETRVAKEDFQEFKKELWARLDRFEDHVANQIKEK